MHGLVENNSNLLKSTVVLTALSPATGAEPTHEKWNLLSAGELAPQTVYTAPQEPVFELIDFQLDLRCISYPAYRLSKIAIQFKNGLQRNDEI